MKNDKIEELIATGLKSDNDEKKIQTLKELTYLISPDKNIVNDAANEKYDELQNLHSDISKEISKIGLVDFENGDDGDQHYLDIDYDGLSQCVKKAPQVETIISEIERKHGYDVYVNHRFYAVFPIDDANQEITSKARDYQEIESLLKEGLKGKIDPNQALSTISTALDLNNPGTSNNHNEALNNEADILTSLRESLDSTLRNFTEITINEETDSSTEFSIYVTRLTLLTKIHSHLSQEIEKIKNEIAKEITLSFFVSDTE